MAPKLTETFNDRAAGGNHSNVTQLHISPAHEPIKDDLMGGINPRSDGGTPPTELPAIAPPFPPAPEVETKPEPTIAEITIEPPVVVQEEPIQLRALPVSYGRPNFVRINSLVQNYVTAPSIAPAAEPKILKVALVGTAPSSRMLAPFNDKSWEIWGCSPGNQNILPRCDVWFEIHGNLLWPEYKHYGEPYLAWLRSLKIPLYMQDSSQAPNALKFPKDELVKEFGQDFFTSSFAWMMAFAIYKGAKELALYGIDMASRDEYILQRPGFYYFRQMARLRGCKVTAPNESDIMMPPGLYGYSDVQPLGRKILAREIEIKQRIAAEEQEVNKRQQNIFYLRGALEDLDYFKCIWIGAQDNSLSE